MAPGRLAGWLDGFAERHGAPVVRLRDDGRVELRAPDGALAVLASPWGAPPDPGDPLGFLLADATRPRRVGALVVRRQAHAVGIFDAGALVAGRHAGHYVQGRTKAGGWSQQRYARRRANQADRAFDAAAADALAVLVPAAPRLDALVSGGERGAVEAVLARPGLEVLAALPRGPWCLPVPDPNASVLATFGEVFTKVAIELNEFA